MDLVRVVLALGYILVCRPEDLWLAHLTALLMSIADAVFNPTWKAAVPSVIDREELKRANGVLSSTQVYGLGAAGIAMLYVIDGVGVFVGGSLVSVLKGQIMSRTLRLFGICYVLQGLLFALFSGTSNLAVGALFLLGMRIASGIIIPIDTYLLQRTVPPELHGRVFSLHSATYGGVMQLSVALTGLMLDQIGHLSGVVMGLVACACGLLWVTALKRIRFTAGVGG
ncbi:MAG TPA: hypothetical protein VD969_03400 [Symbiobacteriaceae bacterium]|nr:hypothetical protein [Symbiobacteriaceae bacterium]